MMVLKAVMKTTAILTGMNQVARKWHQMMDNGGELFSHLWWS